MPTTMPQSQIQEFIDTKIQPAANALQKAAEEQKPKVQDIINKLSEAIKASNPPLISRHLKTLEDLKMPPYASLLPATKALLAQLEKLEPADDSGEDLKKIESLTRSLGELQGRLERNYDRLKELEGLAHDALEQSKTQGSEATEEWAAMEAWLKTQLEAGKVRLRAMEALDDLAKAAVEAGDQGDLADAIKGSQARLTWKPTQKEIEEKFSTFCAKCESSGLSKDLQDQLARDRVAFKKIVDELAGLNKKMDELQARIQNSKIPAVDYKALAHALKIDKAAEKLKAAMKLQGQARAKALEALQKELGVKFPARDLATLMKAKLP